MAISKRSQKNAPDIVLLRGRGLTIGINRSTGRMEQLELNRGGIGRWNTIPGRLEIVDELTQTTFRDGRDPCDVRLRKSGPDQVVIRKRFAKARFTVLETWSVSKAEGLWKVKVLLDDGQKPRSLGIRQYVPWPTDEPFWGWNVWTAQQHFPKALVHVGNTSMVYGDICFGTAIPILSIYKHGEPLYGPGEVDLDPVDVGLSLAKPFGLKIPRWAMIFDGYRSGGVTIESGCMKLAVNHQAETALMLHPHAGCWRPGLDWLIKKYPTYFHAGHPKASELLEGGFLIGTPSTTEEQAKLAKASGAKAVEIHMHYAHYGRYFPESGTWHTVEANGNTINQEVFKPERSVEKINQSIKMFKKHGMAPLLYLQLAGDAYKPYAEREFPESIALNVHGQKMGQRFFKAWMMNSDPSLPFGKFIDQEIDRFFRLYPQAGGIFWDQPCYDDIDSAHHDGLTMVDNKPMYRLVFCYQKHRDKLLREAHKRGMIISSNSPVYIELAEGLDQIMAEGTLWPADVVQYFCTHRPMLAFSYIEDDSEKAEQMFQKALLTGATCYTAWRAKPSGRLKRVFEIYRPLLSRLVGRQWVLEPHPLEMPQGVEGNIFKGRDNNYYVAVLSTRMSLQRAKRLRFNVSIKAVRDVSKVTYWGPSMEAQEAAFTVTDGKAEITLPKHKVVSLVRLSIATHRRRPKQL